MLFIPLLFACQLAGLVEPTPTSPPQQIEQSTPLPTTNPISIPNEPLNGDVIPVPPVSYAPFGTAEAARVNVPVVVPLLQFDLDQVDLAPYSLSDADRETLAQNGFVLQRGEIVSLADVYAGDGPHLVTLDLVWLWTLAVQNDVIEQAEANFTPRQLFDTLAQLTKESEAQIEQALATDDLLSLNAAIKNLSIVSVAGRLYDPNWPISPRVETNATTELALIDSRADVVSQLLDRRINYAIFDEFEDPAEQAQTWLEQSAIRLDPADSPAAQRLAGQQIELLLDIWQSDSAPAWRFLTEAQQQFRAAVPTDIAHWLALKDAGATADSFVLSAQDADLVTFSILPKSDPFYHPLTPIFDALTFNQVGEYEKAGTLPTSAVRTDVGAVRAYPRLYDIAAALGAAPAVDQLDIENETDFVGWDAQMEQLQSRLAQPGSYPASLQLDQMETWQVMLAPAPASYPSYTRSGGWPIDQLSAWENGAALMLAHPAFIDAQAVQVSAEQLITLEPNPELYAALAAQTRRTAEALVRLGRLDAEGAERLVNHEAELLVLKSISESALTGTRPTPDEMALLRRLVSESSTISVPGSWPIAVSAVGGDPLVGRFAGASPLILIMLDGNEQLPVRGVRLMTQLSR